MNIKKITTISGLLILAVGVVAGSFFYFRKMNSNAEADSKVEKLNQVTPFSLSEMIAEMAKSYPEKDEIAVEMCSKDVFDLAYTTIYPMHYDVDENLEFQGLVIECAKKNNVNDYESLLRGVIKSGDDTVQRIRTMACVYNSDYSQRTFAKYRDKINSLFNSCLDVATEYINPEYSVKNKAGQPVSMKEKLLDCQYMTDLSASSMAMMYGLGKMDDDIDKGYYFPYFNLNKFEKLSNTKVPQELVDFMSQERAEFELVVKNEFLKDCLHDDGYYSGYFGRDFITWERENFNQYSDLESLVLSQPPEPETNQILDSNQTFSINDSTRVSDIRQIYSALELYYNDNGSYPSSIIPGQTLSNSTTTYMAVIPSNPTPWDEGDCPSPGSDYVYKQQAGGVSYTLTFCLAHQSGTFAPGIHNATPNGL